MGMFVEGCGQTTACSSMYCCCCVVIVWHSFMCFLSCLPHDVYKHVYFSVNNSCFNMRRDLSRPSFMSTGEGLHIPGKLLSIFHRLYIAIYFITSLYAVWNLKSFSLQSGHESPLIKCFKRQLVWMH